MTGVNHKILREMRKFNDNFAKFPAGRVITKRVNSELSKWIMTMKRLCCANAQDLGREYLTLDGIPGQIDANNLESKMLAIFKKFSCIIDSIFIFDGCHCLDENNENNELFSSSCVARIANKF